MGKLSTTNIVFYIDGGEYVSRPKVQGNIFMQAYN